MKCCTWAKGNRNIQMNRQLTTIHGALLFVNRSIQAEGVFGVIKWNCSYKRVFRRGLESVF